MEHESPLRSLSDDELLRRLADLLGHSRRMEADLVAHIGEVDSRRLFAREAFPSMYAYCTEVLHLSEAEAYLRITVARAARSFPQILDLVRDGRLHLTGIVRLVPHLTLANAEVLLTQATHKSKRQILELVASIAPRPDVPAAMRRLPVRREVASRYSTATSTGSTATSTDSTPVTVGGLILGPTRGRPSVENMCKLSPAGEGLVEPLAPARYKVQFTASAELHDKLQRLQALLRSSIPDGDLGAVIEEAVTEKLEHLEAKRFARTQAPRMGLSETDFSPNSRHIPAAVRRAVALRDGSRCRYVDVTGRRCSAREGLEFHHRHPYGLGGDHSPRNIKLLCRQHNVYLAERDYGRKTMERPRATT